MYIIKDIDNNAYFTGEFNKGLLYETVPEFHCKERKAKQYPKIDAFPTAKYLAAREGRPMEVKKI